MRLNKQFTVFTVTLSEIKNGAIEKDKILKKPF